MTDKEKLLDALETIQNVCKEHSICKNCPLAGITENCGIGAKNPCDWIIAERSAIWRALS